MPELNRLLFGGSNPEEILANRRTATEKIASALNRHPEGPHDFVGITMNTETGKEPTEGIAVARARNPQKREFNDWKHYPVGTSTPTTVEQFLTENEHSLNQSGHVGAYADYAQKRPSARADVYDSVDLHPSSPWGFKSAKADMQENNQDSMFDIKQMEGYTNLQKTPDANPALRGANQRLEQHYKAIGDAFQTQQHQSLMNSIKSAQRSAQYLPPSDNPYWRAKGA